jgi:hypothetical protein
LSWSQYTFESITADPVFCNNDFKTYVLKITHPTSAPSLVTLPSSNSNNGNLFISMPSSSPDSTHVGAGIDTSFYTVNVSPNGTVIPNGVVLGEAFIIDINDDLGFPEIGTNVTGLTVYGCIEVYFDLGRSVICANGQAVDLFQFVTIPGGEFSFFDDALALIYLIQLSITKTHLALVYTLNIL